MVMTTSAARTKSVVSRLGRSREMSRPISAITWTTAGLSSSAGCDPADVTRTLPAALWSSRAAAIWDRPALWVQTKRTSGSAVMCVPPWLPGQLGLLVGLAQPDRVNDDGQDRAEEAADYLRGDECRGRAGRDPGVGVSERPADGDGRVGEGRGSGEPVGGADPGAYGPGSMLGPARAYERDDDQPQAGRSGALAQQQRQPGPISSRWAQRGLAEHDVSECRPGYRSGDLADDDGGGLADALAAAAATPESPVRGGDDGIEMRSARRGEHQDEHGQTQRGRQ